MLKLIIGIIALITGVVLNDKSKYPTGSTASKWAIPLMVIGVGIIVWALFFSNKTDLGPGAKFTPTRIGKFFGMKAH